MKYDLKTAERNIFQNLFGEHQKLVYSTNPRSRKQPDFTLLFIQFTYHYIFKTTTASWGFILTSDKPLNAVEIKEETVQGLNS